MHLGATWPQGNRCRHAHGNKELRSFRPEARMAMGLGYEAKLDDFGVYAIMPSNTLGMIMMYR